MTATPVSTQHPTTTHDEHDAAAFLLDVVSRPRLWRRRVPKYPTRRHETRLFLTPEFDVWLTTWAPGAGIPLHDHGGVAGAYSVVRGALVESHYEQRLDANPEFRLATRNEVITISEHHVHSLMNLDDTPAVSLHVYTPALTEVHYFRTHGPDLRRSRIEPVEARLTAPR